MSSSTGTGRLPTTPKQVEIQPTWSSNKFKFKKRGSSESGQITLVDDSGHKSSNDDKNNENALRNGSPTNPTMAVMEANLTLQIGSVTVQPPNDGQVFIGVESQSPEVISPDSPETFISFPRAGIPVQSSSRLHWNQIRNAIIPGIHGHNRSATESTVNSIDVNSIPRPQTPKQFRLPRRGFRQVIEQTRDYIQEESEKFELDIYQACYKARFGEMRGRIEKEMQLGYLPFLASGSISLPNSASSQPSRVNNETHGRIKPSVSQLYHTLVRYASTTRSTLLSRLPYEAEVLSVLSVPFVSDGSLNAEEQWMAIEAFEIAIGSWQPSSKQREIDRILWCCKVALIPPSPVKSRIIATLSTLLFSSKPFDGATVPAFQNVLHGLQLILYHISQAHSPSSNDSNIVRELLMHIRSGQCGDLRKGIIEEEYGAKWSHNDSEDDIRLHVVAETLTRCMQSDTDGFKRWSLDELFNTYWIPSDRPTTTLSEKIMLRKMGYFLRAATTLLRPENNELMDKKIFESDCAKLLPFVKSDILEKVYKLPLPSSLVDHCTLAVELLLQLLFSQRIDMREVVTDTLCQWCRNGNEHRKAFFLGLRFLVEGIDWHYLSTLVLAITSSLPEDERNEMLATIIPGIYSRLIINMNWRPSSEVTPLLNLLVEYSPRLFYKPIFALAGASKDITLVGQLANVVMMAKHMPHFWTGDSEMLAIALISEPSSPPKSIPGHGRAWGKIRLGKSLILLELILFIRALTKKKAELLQPPDSSQSEAYRFLAGLETRLSVLVEAKEKDTIIPFSQRILISVLFLEIRLFTCSLKPFMTITQRLAFSAPWLSIILSWTTQAYIGASLTTSNDIVSKELFNEVTESFEKMQNIYKTCFESPSTRRTSAIARQSLVPLASQFQTDSQVAEEVMLRIQAITSLPNTSAAVLHLLVAVYALIKPIDYQTLCPVLWSQFMDETDVQTIEPASFLLTIALERSGEAVAEFIRKELTSPDVAVKRLAIRRVMILFGWRSQLLSQTYICDESRRRPFMFAREPIAFVSVDAGSNVYIAESSDEENTTVAGISLPSDLRKRLAEIGWDDKVRSKDSRLEKTRIPLSLFSLIQLMEQCNLSKVFSVKGHVPGKPLLHRKSSTQNVGQRHRPVFVPALVAIFGSLSCLTTDPDACIAASAREAIHIMLRDDPLMICRPSMEELSSNKVSIEAVISTFRYFLHVHCSLPPSAAHYIFGHLSGFLKYISRHPYHPDNLQMFAYTVPVLSTLVPQVRNLSMRDIRRTKMEIFVFPIGSLWFPPTAPDTPMFPRYLESEHRTEETPRQLEYICMIRTAQNLFLLGMLKHKSKELHIARRRLMNLQLPDDPTGAELELCNFIPNRSCSPPRNNFQQVSLALSRTYLLLLGQIFHVMPRNFNGRAELKKLFDGLNRILLAHGNDIGIVAHALIACMIAMTRFKRLVAAGGGFAMFMPSILKVYAEAEKHIGIQYAIQYASSRFYAVHEENYLYQSLDTVSKLLVTYNSPEDKEWFAGRIWLFFSSLKTNPQAVYDIAGIFDMNKSEERELLIASTVTDDLPLTSTTSETPDNEQIKKILVTGQFENKLLRPDDLIKLFFTVIAYNPTVIRAYNFLALLRRMVPYFYEGSKSSRDVLREGIGALGQALFPKASRQKVSESAQTRQANQALSEDIPKDIKNTFEDNLTPRDEVSMRREYLGLIVAYVQVAQDLRPNTMKLSLDLLTGLLKDLTRSDPGSESILFKGLVGSSLLQSTVNLKYTSLLLRELAPIIRVFALTTDCSGVIDSITELLKRPEFARDVNFVELITEEIASPLLEACEDAGSENLLFTLPMRSSLVSLLVQIATLESSDIADILEKRKPTPGFLSGIFLPFCMMVKTTIEVETESQFKHQARALKDGATFVRIIAYVMAACQVGADPDGTKPSPVPGTSRKNSQRNKHSGLAARIALATKITSVQIIKVLVLRATANISIGLGGIWGRIAYFLKDLLADGNAKFAFSKKISPLPSPYLSSRGGYSGPFSRRSSSIEGPSFMSRPINRRPRVVDYLTWSVLEFLCRSPSPLNLQMRLWMQEKVHELDSHLKILDMPGMLFTRHSRRASSIFIRPRGSSTSPDALYPSQSRLSEVPSDLNLLTPASQDRGLHIQFTPTTSSIPSRRNSNVPDMTPIRDTPPSKASEPQSGQSTRPNSDILISPKLLAITFERIRLVQVYMGYDRLLFVEGQMDDVDGIKFKPWTMSSAQLMMANEMKLLMDEFSECFFETLKGDFIDIPNPEGDELHSDF
ncbi:hypothetical protein Clacol_009167 [Clathrus columnatus]|uniref:Protein UNC80 C-terminal domain-containing protein n=1 Tax=Clathrus columnatus TaxID=1419009 RepID=A0AAV5AJS1_9AGAM|nr:hypothetical protein Clacol_009167 [Clathrus columnatus]